MEKEVKGDARNDRLVLRKTNEEVLRKQHHNEGNHDDNDHRLYTSFGIINYHHSI